MTKSLKPNMSFNAKRLSLKKNNKAIRRIEMDRTLFENISIGGRLAFGVSCLELLYKAWNVNNEKMDYFVETLWTFTKAEMLNEWDDNIRLLLPNNDRTESYANKFGYEKLETNQQEILTNTIWNVMEIGQGNLYGEYNSKYSLLPLLNVIETLEENGVNLPNITLFEKSKVDKSHGWGNPVDKSLFVP